MSTAKLRELLHRHAPAHGTADTPIEGLQLIRVTRSLPTVPAIYPASLCFLVDGQKRVYLGGEVLTYGEGSLLCCTMPLPVEAEVPEASPKRPVLGLLLSLSTQSMMETVVAAEATGELPALTEDSESTPGLVVSPWEDALVDALARLVELLDDPCARRVLAPSRLREVYFALLRGEAGQALRQTFDANRDLGRALAYLNAHIAEPLSVEALARVAGMSRAVFHRRFKAMTSLSPLQFIKAVRLNNAAALLAGGLNVAEAAEQVGYRSPSQFSREFSRLYGMPPRQWAAASGEGA
ncbi:MAG: AraC family transcriptional regulator [Alphaproteobacteria bacterium]|nr:AraC family transcriptional regulator [Alphaproteobacteria bacterium]MCB9791454.1 AraC family transcriptional regulator [Alphaproteobacteria bacterium]